MRRTVLSACKLSPTWFATAASSSGLKSDDVFRFTNTRLEKENNSSSSFQKPQKKNSSATFWKTSGGSMKQFSSLFPATVMQSSAALNVTMRTCHTTATSSNAHDVVVVDFEDLPQQVFNVFNGRLVRKGTGVIASLMEIGVGFVRGAPSSSQSSAPNAVAADGAVQMLPSTHHQVRMQIVDHDAFNAFADAVRSGTASLPVTWNAAMVEGIGYIIKNQSIKNPAAHTEQWMQNLSKFAKSRRSTGIISGGDAEGMSSLQEEEEQVTLTAEQQKIIDLAKTGVNLCISGNAGTGKTVLLRSLRRALSRQQLQVGMCATTGIAGCHVGGATFHHILGVNTQDEFLKPKNLLKFDVIIIDEISMMTRSLFETFDRQMRLATGNMTQAFGGVQVILCGDFLQLGSIPYAPIFHSIAFQHNFVPVRLTQQIRQDRQHEFSAMLQTLRKGKVPANLREVVRCSDEPELAKDAVNLLPTNEQVNKANRDELERLEGEPFSFSPVVKTPELQGTWTPTALLKIDEATFNPEVFREQFISMLDKKVKISNPKIVSLFQCYSDGYVLRVQLSANEPEAWRTALTKRYQELVGMIDTMQFGCTVQDFVEDGNGFQTADDEELLGKMIKKHPVVETNEFKVGARVLLRANLSREFVNGSVGTVVDFVECSEDNIMSSFLTDAVRDNIARYINEMKFISGFETIPSIPLVQFGGPTGKVIAVPPWQFTVGGDASTNYYGVSALCVPLSLAYAFTVHKVQGLTLVGRVHLELSKMWPCEHLLYVAMSRVKTPDQLTISCFNDEMVVADSKAVAFDEEIQPVDALQVPAYVPTAVWKNMDEQTRALKKHAGGKRKSSAVGLAAKHHTQKDKEIAKFAKFATKKMSAWREKRYAEKAAELAAPPIE